MSAKSVRVGNITIGGGAPVTVQSMLCVLACDIEGNVEQAKRLEAAGCDIIRATVPSADNAPLIAALKNSVKTPIVADVHFDYRAAIAAVEAGADKIRINPGNIGGEERVRLVADACRANKTTIRVGVNGGSLEKELLQQYGATPRALCESALRAVALLESFGFYDTVVSIKSSSVRSMVDSCRMFAAKSQYPLHIGVTEAGTYDSGIIKSAAGIGALLLDGIGDTIRVSLTDSPEREVEAGIGILRALGLRRDRPEIVSCPTCGRTEIDLIEIVARVEQAVKDIKKPLKIAIMGCVVNGPGEAADADIGIAGGYNSAVLFRKGAPAERISGDIAARLIDEIHKL